MATNWICGLESGSLSSEPGQVAGSTIDSSAGAVSLEASIVRSGSGSLKVNPGSSAAGWWRPVSNGNWVTSNGRVQFYVRVTALPSAARQLFGTSTTGPGSCLDINSDGTLKLNGTSSVTSSVALTDTARWYRVAIDLTTGELFIDGASQGTASGIASSWNAFGCASTSVAATYTAYFDDMISSDTAMPVDGKVVILLPISDNTRTNWTAGAGGTTNLWGAIDNRPPAGVASGSETNTSNIESASNSGTATYIADMQSYTTGGVGSSDTVNAVLAWVNHGEDIATGSKTGSVEMTSNPVVSAATFTFGGDAGAHGAFVGNWRNTRAAAADAPSLTLGDSPAVKVVKTDTTTRTGCIDFMAVYAQYTPAVVTEPVRPEKVVLQAVNRSNVW